MLKREGALLLGKSTFRLTTSVSVLLVLAFVGTGFVSSAYQRRKEALGDSHYRNGLALEAKGKLPEAVEEYRQALLFSPDKPEYRISFAAALVGSGHLDEAESHIDQLLQQDPTNGALNLTRARIARDRKQIPTAIGYYQRAVYEYWPPGRADERRQARWELISLLEKSGKREATVGELMTLYANAALDPKARVKVGFELLKNHATSEATQVFRDLIRVAPRDPETHRGMGEALFASGQYVSARHEFERALHLLPNEPEATKSLALTNSVIEMNPTLPGLPAAEQSRRSQNLLRRVISQLRKCGGNAELERQLGTADNLLNQKRHRTADWTSDLQNQAQQLWAKYGSLCGRKEPEDVALAAVLERFSSE